MTHPEAWQHLKDLGNTHICHIYLYFIQRAAVEAVGDQLLFEQNNTCQQQHDQPQPFIAHWGLYKQLYLHNSRLLWVKTYWIHPPVAQALPEISSA